ncbi:hypothetical protein [Lepagella muris]|jgi:hypothetical protein|uniref:Uncharacterized protein n=1 Tax=Lepagella muris TaxID=3032870 RepID=A0AC61RJ58_9BACT|nr:hypothetical protein [Lepagella muris]ROT08339.1 hypothetical protein EEL33_04615 [Muribaculaceae bacterium Isolate-037 (Harlan)]TGY79805.1 hypothetical protein E5331_05365 [Lepagella muris]THG51791.1 hypothetical protein E5984_09785 [Bacteroidales bacterium]TKC54423.1 hypothetical protein E5359_018390 [Bacteroidales bacterium]
MKLFIWALCITSFLQFFTARYAKDFNGASVGMFNYLNFMTWFVGFTIYGLLIWSCFLTTWWVPIAAFGVTFVVKVVFPPLPGLELVSAFLLPIAYLTSIVFLIMQI